MSVIWRSDMTSTHNTICYFVLTSFTLLSFSQVSDLQPSRTFFDLLEIVNRSKRAYIDTCVSCVKV